MLKRISVASLAVISFGLATCSLRAQSQNVVAIRAGRLFDGKSNNLLDDQVIVIRGERISEVGPAASISIPAGAKQIDLTHATVIPGLIDAHTHVLLWPRTRPGGIFLGFDEGFLLNYSWQYRTIAAVVNAKKDLDAGFTSIRDCSSVGAKYSDVDVRNSINNGLVPGPRMQVATIPVIGSAWYPLDHPSPEVSVPQAGFVANSPEEGRQAVRKDVMYGADLIKVFTGGVKIRVLPDGRLWENSTMTTGEAKAIVDEAHRQGVKAACHAYGGVPLEQSMEAGCDSIELGVDLDAEAIQRMARQGTFLVMTLSFMRALRARDLEMSEGRGSRADLQKPSFQRALKAGVKIAFGTDAGAATAHGTQAKEFETMVEYGMTPAQALHAATTVAAELMGWQGQVGSIEAGKYADIDAVSGDPLKDITELERIKFVMKGGSVVRNDVQ